MRRCDAYQCTCFGARAKENYPRDRQRQVRRRIVSTHNAARVTTHGGDVTHPPGRDLPAFFERAIVDPSVVKGTPYQGLAVRSGREDLSKSLEGLPTLP